MKKALGIALGAIILCSSYALADNSKKNFEEWKAKSYQEAEQRREKKKTSKYWQKNLEDVMDNSEEYQGWHLGIKAIPEDYEIRMSSENGRIRGNILLKGGTQYMDCKVDCEDIISNETYPKGDFFSFLTRLHYATKEEKQSIKVSGKYIGNDLILHEIEIMNEKYLLK